MPQNINLCTPAYRPARQPFNAPTMAAALVAALLLGGSGCVVLVQRMQQARQEWTLSMRTQSDALQSVQQALQQRKAATQPAAAALLREQQEARALVQQLEQRVQTMQEGLWPAGQRHSDRLRLLSRTIPAAVWLTGVRADSAYLELSGGTVEPAALNPWMAELSASPLLKGVPLSAVKVQRGNPSSGAAAAVGSAAAASTADWWTFQLVSAPAAAAPAHPLENRP